MSSDAERDACTPEPVDPAGFNPNTVLPYQLTVEHVRKAMEDFLGFLELVNSQLNGNGIDRMETILMPANFSSMVGEFMVAGISKHCPTLSKNQYHNGHPDLIPAGMYENNAAQYAEEGIEVKGSRYMKAWQGHNPEESWLMVFVFDANRGKDKAEGKPPMSFRFIKVVGAQLTKDDWKFSGRSETSRRTITASVTDSGFEKMEANWIYHRPGH